MARQTLIIERRYSNPAEESYRADLEICAEALLELARHLLYEKARISSDIRIGAIRSAKQTRDY